MFTIPELHTALQPLVCWSGAFTDEEIENIIELGDQQQFQEARVGNNDEVISTIRQSEVSWITPTHENAWLFNKMVELIANVNRDKFQFELSHIESFQYTTYTSGGFYSWHIDGEVKDTFTPRHRKLGLSLMLSDPETDFTGGEFQIIPGGNPSDIQGTKIKKGDIIMFPAFVPHQVAEVTSGTRKSLVCWILGPKFK